MGARFSGFDNNLNKNNYLNRLANVESIDENDPFWNQLLSFPNNIEFSKANSKLLDESVALICQKFHQNNLESGNYASLIKVFCIRAVELRNMTDNHIITMQTANALLLIRCFTKYIIEIENERALLEQLNAKAFPKKQPVTTVDDLNKVLSTSGISTEPSSLPSSPKSNFKNRNLFKKQQKSLNKDDSQEETTHEIDSDFDSNYNSSDTQNSKKPNGNESNDDNYEDDNDILYLLLKNLFEICIEVPVESHTYNLHLEALNTILILSSVQMYTKTPTHESFIYETLMIRLNRYVSEFVKVLLRHIIQQMPSPSPSQNYLEANNQPQRSIMSSVASGLWSVVTLGYGSAAAPTATSESDKNEIITYLPKISSDNSGSGNVNGYDTPIDCSARFLAWQSCHILLVLSNQCTNESLHNPYRLALFHFTDTQDTPTNLPNSEPLPWFSIDYSKLFQMFTFTLHTDQYTLLFYMLLHRNQHFKMFILSRFNIDLLMIPILKVVFTAPERNSHHIYMALIILLILSEDDIFNKTIHTIPIKKLNWYTERSLSEISLGGLLILIVIRTIQFNMTRMRDKYLHTNCLAALANMSAKFHNLHPYVCQRINSLFNLLAKKRSKIISSLNSAGSKDEPENQQKDSESSNDGNDLLQDLSIIDELMRMVLEIINSCLTSSLHHNSNLIYSILYHKSIYLQFRDHPSFQDVIQNIDTVITSFSCDVDNLEDKSIENVKEMIDMGVKQFPRDRFRKFPDLKFKYVEEDQPEEFFVPYVWSLVYKFSNLYWIDHVIKFFGSPDANS